MSKKFLSQIQSTVATGTAPLIVASTTAVTNLNADLLDGQHGAYFAPIASPTLTGTPLSTTAAVDTNTTQIATTAYVMGQSYLKTATASSTYAPLASPTFTGTATIPLLSLTTADTATASSHYMVEVASDGIIRPKTLANVKIEILTSAALLGTPTAPTATAGTNTTQIATTAFVTTAVAGGGAGFDAFFLPL